MATQRVHEYATPDQDLLLHKYRKHVYQFSYVLDSFNDFLQFGIPKALASRPIDLGNGRIAYLELSGITPPMLYVETNSGPVSVKLYRDAALLYGKTYSVDINVKVKIVEPRGKSTRTTHSSLEATLLKIPIPVYSYYCYDKAAIENENEPSDPGCYFIIDGQRHVILLLEKNRQDQLIIGVDNSVNPPRPYVSQLSETPFSTSSTSIYMDLHEATDDNPSVNIVCVAMKKYIFSQTDQDEEDDHTGLDEYVDLADTSTKKQKKPTVNVLATAHVMMNVLLGKSRASTGSKKSLKASVGARRDEIIDLFLEHIKNIIPQDRFLISWSRFISTISEYRDMSEDDMYSAVLFGIGLADQENMTEAKSEEQIYKLGVYFSDNVFPVWTDANRKLMMLINMTSRLLQYFANYIPATDKNHWGGMSLVPAGEILMGTFRRKFASLVGEAMKEVGNRHVSADEVLDIVSNIDMESRFMSEFKPSKSTSGPSKPTTDKSKAKNIKIQSGANKSISIVATPINTIDMRAMLTKTRNNARKESVSYTIRAVQPSFFAFMCSLKATENSKCGITKFIGSLSILSRSSNPETLIRTLLEWIFKSTGKPVVTLERHKKTNTVPVSVNGLIIGYTNKEFGYRNIIMMKRRNLIDMYTAVVKTKSGTIEMYCNSSRLMIPVVVVDQNTNRPAIYNDPQWRKMSFNDMLRVGYVEYLDNYEIENLDVTVAQTFNSFVNYETELIELERIRATTLDTKIMVNIEREIASMILGKYKYGLLHPISIYGVTTALGFDPSKMASCRVAFADKMQCQTLHTGLGIEDEMVGGYQSISCTKSIVKSAVNTILRLEDEVVGQSVTVLFAPTYENQEDAVIVNRGMIDAGLCRWRNTVIIKYSLEPGEKFGIVSNGIVPPYHLRNLNTNGMPVVGAFFKEDDVILGILEEGKADTKTKGGVTGNVIIDRSIRLERDEWGYVTEVVSYYTLKSSKNCARQKTVMIKLVHFGKLQVGDKVATRHAQKHIASVIHSPENMLFCGGVTADMVINTLCVPTRMTPGTLYEPLVSTATASDGVIRDVGAHKPMNIDEIKTSLLKAGFTSNGMARWTSGITGKRLQAESFSGFSRVNLLAHIANQKMQCRAIGKKSKITGQAESSKYGVARNKGQKVAREELSQMLKYGSKFLAWERMNMSCDGVTVVVCLLCSSYASYDPTTNKYSCAYCGVSKRSTECKGLFGKYMDTQTRMFLDAGLTSIGVQPRPRFVTAEEYMSAPCPLQGAGSSCIPFNTDFEPDVDEV